MIRLIGIDVDGTLVGASGVVDPAIWRAVERVRAAGIHLALSSGRPAFGLALEYAQRLDDGWHSFQNGASIVHLASGRSQSSSFPPDLVGVLIARARESGRLLELYSDNDFVCESTSDWAREHAALLGVPFDPRPFESLRGSAVRVQWLVAPADAAQTIAEAPAALEAAESTSPLMPDTAFIGMTRKGISKGSALRTIISDYGMSLDQVMFVGDARNDLSALRIVGYPVAMANADPAVLRIARHVAGDVEKAGLVNALEYALAENSKV